MLQEAEALPIPVLSRNATAQKIMLQQDSANLELGQDHNRAAAEASQLWTVNGTAGLTSLQHGRTEQKL